ncbi:phosphatase PAP2 family protein [Hymenobacter bucti]|uniref:Phosphatase PAP2 family protein n=1 Tax=Hymenobacter bucti TaxID=1844114 RepID=A0ABW4QWH5_9BACT
MKFTFSRHPGRWLLGAFWALALSASAAPRPAVYYPADSGQVAAPDTTSRPAADLAAPADSGKLKVKIKPGHRPWRTDYTVAPGVTYHYERPGQLRWLLHIPRDIVQFPGTYFKRDNVPAFVGIALSSLALYAADDQIINGAQRFGRYVGLDKADIQNNLFYIPIRLGSTKVPLELKVPGNLNSTFYYLGDGWTHLTIATSFLAYGIIKKDNRASQTASQLGEAILSTGVVVQALKRTTGRQSPFRSTQDRGRWFLLPAYKSYQNNVSNYDAFPTGHLATAMATVTVIAENYPEYKFIRPVGYSLMGVLGYAMLNNGVHWASDYPLGIAIGYGFAKIAVRNGRTRVPEPAGPSAGGTGWQAPAHPKPWYRQPQLSPYTLGPFRGLSVSWLPR